jgi:regulator of ribonuclease activity A
MRDDPRTADLIDEHGEALASCDLQLRQFGGRPRFGGRVRTIACRHDNALVGQVLGEPGVVNGAVRDVAELARIPIEVKALGSNPRRSAKTGAGRVDVPVGFGEATFRPGAYLYSDEDGIVVGDRPLAPDRPS